MFWCRALRLVQLQHSCSKTRRLCPHLFATHSATEAIALTAALIITAALLSFAGAASVLVLLPADYFAGDLPPRLFAARHPVVRIALLTLKNFYQTFLHRTRHHHGGARCAWAGPAHIAFTGFLLVDFPGKFRLERRLIAVPRVQHIVNKVRVRMRRPPLVLPAQTVPGDSARSQSEASKKSIEKLTEPISGLLHQLAADARIALVGINRQPKRMPVAFLIARIFVIDAKPRARTNSRRSRINQIGRPA